MATWWPSLGAFRRHRNALLSENRHLAALMPRRLHLEKNAFSSMAEGTRERINTRKLR